MIAEVALSVSGSLSKKQRTIAVGVEGVVADIFRHAGVPAEVHVANGRPMPGKHRTVKVDIAVAGTSDEIHAIDSEKGGVRSGYPQNERSQTIRERLLEVLRLETTLEITIHYVQAE